MEQPRHHVGSTRTTSPVPGDKPPDPSYRQGKDVLISPPMVPGLAKTAINRKDQEVREGRVVDTEERPTGDAHDVPTEA